MGRPAGTIYHPVYGEAIAADNDKRRELVKQLKRNADDANSKGDRLLLDKQYQQSNRYWQYAARCMRASQAIGYGKATDREDYGLIGRAWLAVQHGDREIHDWVDQVLKETT